MPPERVAAYILAGGRSSRMGRDKALLELGGRTSIERVHAVAAGVAASVTIVADQPAPYRFLGCAVVSDPEPGLGPIGGLAAALADSESEWALVLGCDLPFLTADLLRALAACAEPTLDAVVPTDAGGTLQPLCALYSRRCRPEVEGMIAAGDRAVHRLVARVRARVVQWSEVEPLPGAELFFLAMNDPASYERAREIAESE